MTTKEKRKVAIGSLVVVAGLLLTAAASFGHGMHSRGDGVGPYGPLLERALERLGIAGEQKARVQEVIDRHRPEAEPLVRQMVTERRALRRLIQDGTADEKAVRSQAGKVGALESDLAVMRSRVWKEVRPLLTPEQTAKLAEIQAEWEKKADRFMERRHQGRPEEKR